MQPQILVLKEGTEAHQGKAQVGSKHETNEEINFCGNDAFNKFLQVVSNINACQAVVDAVRTTLGPRGMDKLVVDQR